MSRARMESNEQYLDDLLLALRMRGVPGDRCGGILAEARDHLAVTGAAADEKFGPAREYAATWAADHGSRLRAVDYLVAVLSGILGFLGGLLIYSGARSIAGSADAMWGMPPWSAVVLGVALLLGMMLLIRTREDPVSYPPGAGGPGKRQRLPTIISWAVPALAVAALVAAGLLVGAAESGGL
ncbi:hypothetical protein [Lolliginicoccus levis]|uniref:hypothetical protein n=1 Tax=Lolliginicoccus levis TaxID=2919542 RepID=UPI00241CA643|nr:hypothetical protein [Lolliginicoccus levis]